MFKGHAQVDFSGDLREPEYWDVGNLDALQFCSDITALAVDPISRLLAVGTSGGYIHILGAPGIHAEIKLPATTPVKFIEFASSLYKLVCIDESDKLIIYDLSSLGQIKVEVITRVERPVTSISIPPSLTHAFLCLESGEIKTYDLLCRRFSIYTIPNAWDSYEKISQAEGMIVDSDGESRIPSQILSHPRNLNLVFVAYGGGVILVDLKGYNTLRIYELLIPAGAPGGAGYTDPGLLRHRRPAVTTMAIHPSGHFFVVGHVDGSFAFWAVEDDDKPLLVRTLDEVDVNIVDGNALDRYLPGGEGSSAPHKPREPIFKLAWSGYPNSTDVRGGETSLIILGGQYAQDPAGVNVLWLPAFNPHTAPPLPGDQRGLHPHYRQAMRASVEVRDAYFYATSGLTQDFLLIPRESPHHAGTWDPNAVIYLSEGSDNSRTVEAFAFPPPSFLSSSEEDTVAATKPTSPNSAERFEEDLASTLRDLEVSSDPAKLPMGPILWNGPAGVVNAILTSTDLLAHESLYAVQDDDPTEFRLEGGVAIADQDVIGHIRMSKFDPHRILITTHVDQTIRFLDVSVQLLVPPAGDLLVSPFPTTMPSLSIDPLSVLSHPSICDRYHINPQQLPTVQSVQFLAEALEVAIVLSTGAVILYRLNGSRMSSQERPLDDLELASLEHVPVSTGLRFHPILMVLPVEPVSSFALTSIGFAAVGYTSGALIIIDLRGPSVIHREGSDKQPRRHSLGSILHKHAANADTVISLTWTICGLHSDPQAKVRLVAIRASGRATVFTAARTGDGVWAIPPTSTSSEMIPPLQNATFVLDARLGSQLKADKNRLAFALDRERVEAEVKRGDDGHKCLLVVVGSKGARCYGDLDGDKRVGKAEWSSKAGMALAAQVVERSASFVLVVATDKHQALVYSLPSLEQLHTLTLTTVSPSPPSIDTSGDMITLAYPPGRSPSPHTASSGAVLDSFFSAKRGYHDPKVSLTERKDGVCLKIPPQPQPVDLGPAGILAGAGALFGGLMGTGAPTGAQIDALLAGPDRPIPEKPVPRAEREGYVEWKAPDKSTSRPSIGTQDSSRLYARLQNALAERGDALNGLEENFSSLGQASEGMLDQAKRLATEQSAKGWFGRKFGL
ncbi:hypothetical protein PENSPDRAFT_578479 [Peniophora sp. CONT]|nr:hypothetical protein PENSPDRAFT_578479 [Peniophora sp. CONT]